MLFRSLRANDARCLRPGQKLKFDIMRSRYGASFSTIREAMSKLTSEGLILADGQRGFQVTPVSSQDLNDLANARVLIETQAIRLAIRWGDERWENGIKTAQQRLAQVKLPAGQSRNDSAEWTRQHREFHMALLSGCGSPVLLEFAAILFARAHRYRRLAEIIRRKKDKITEHGDIAKACLARDVARATYLVERHIRQTAENILDCLSTV